MELFGEYENDKDFCNKALNFLKIVENKKIIVWGAGKATKNLISDAGKNLQIKYIVDKNQDLQNTSLQGYKILSPKRIRKESPDKVVIVIMPYCYDKYLIAEDLIAWGFRENSYCFGYDYMLAFNYFKKNKVFIPVLDLLITSFCTLKCKNCIAHLPYYKQNRHHHLSFEFIKTDIDSIFSVAEYIDLLSFSTGEAILHPDFRKIVVYIAGEYGKKYGLLHLVTNGTVIPKTDVLKTLSEYDCHVYISNYSHVIGKRSKIEELIGLFEEHHIAYSVFNDFQAGRFGMPSWNDLGDINTSHGKSEEEKIELYHKCANHNCFVAHDDKIYACGSACWGAFGGVYEPASLPEEGDYIRISKVSEDRLDLIKFFHRATAKGYPAICDRCDGVGPLINQKVIPAGEQLDPIKASFD